MLIFSNVFFEEGSIYLRTYEVILIFNSVIFSVLFSQCFGSASVSVRIRLVRIEHFNVGQCVWMRIRIQIQGFEDQE
jgi:hypothetical protein